MMRPMGNVWRLAVAAVAVATACAPISDRTATGTADKCTKDNLGTLYPGIFTFGTDQPVYPPWYMGDNPASGEGFEASGGLRRREHDGLHARRGAVGQGAVQCGAGTRPKDV